jgi:CBS domain-containing protein
VPAWWSVRRFVEEGGLVRDAVLVHDDGGRPSGIVTGADLARLPAATWDTTVLGGVAVPVAVLERVEASESVAAVLGRWDGRPLAVVRDGSIVGVLSAAHLLRVAAWGRLAGRTGTRVG